MKQKIIKIAVLVIGLVFTLSTTVLAGYNSWKNKTHGKTTENIEPQIIEVLEETVEVVKNNFSTTESTTPTPTPTGRTESNTESLEASERSNNDNNSKDDEDNNEIESHREED